MKKEIIKYLKSNSFDIQNSRSTFTIMELAFREFAKSFNKMFVYFIFSDFNNFYSVIPLKNLERISFNLYRRYKKDKTYLNKKLKQHEGLYNKIEKVYKEYLNTNNLLASYLKLIEVSGPFWQECVYVEDKGANVFKMLVNNFSKKYNINQTKAQEIVNTLSHPQELSIVNLARQQFLAICLSILDKQAVDKKIQQYLKEYFWIKTNYYGLVKITPSQVFKEAQKEIKENTKSKIQKEYNDLDNSLVKIAKQKKEILKKYKFTKEEFDDLKFLEKIIFWTEQRKKYMIKSLYYLFTVLTKIGQVRKIKYSDLAFYNIKEVEDLLKKDKRLTKEQIKGRLKGAFLILHKDLKPKLYTGKDAQLMFKLAIQNKEQGDLKGTVACTGGQENVSGVVRIVYSLKDKFKPGEILVTSMTRVEVTPLMKIARAIITNEGGIACHASIVSREMNKPCIIGTKNATRFLKDGDRISLDMVKGLVKIIE